MNAHLTDSHSPAAMPHLPGHVADVAAELNDVHSRLNPTTVARVVPVADEADVAAALDLARCRRMRVSIAGARHAMGGQQFRAGSLHLDMSGLDGVLAFDAARGLIEVQAGIQWPAIVRFLHDAQPPHAPHAWAIAQKQTGADRLSLGGALSANVHGRGLCMRPFVADVEQFTLMRADGSIATCSRSQNAELFALAIGGYGLFGVLLRVTLRLVRRRRVRRHVVLLHADELIPTLERRIAEGCTYGDFQFAIDPRSEDFLRRGVCSCYAPVADDVPITPSPRALREADWLELLRLAHADKPRAFEQYAAHYLATNGQVYWSDAHQLSTYVDDYHRSLDATLGATCPGSETIAELYVPRDRLAEFLAGARAILRQRRASVIYGTIRLIERDDETVLNWARDRYACMVLNLHVDHTAASIASAQDAFRELADAAITRRGSFYLTYSRYATREQLAACYPRLGEFLRARRRHDPAGVFESEWSCWLERMSGDSNRNVPQPMRQASGPTVPRLEKATPPTGVEPVSVAPQATQWQDLTDSAVSDWRIDARIQPANSPISGDVAELVAAWPALPEPIRAGVLAMIRSATGGGR